MWRDLQGEIAEEFGAASEGKREFFAADAGWSFRRLPKLTDEKFARMLNTLKAVKWNREHPERRREIALKYAMRPEVKARYLAQAKARRAARPPEALVCAECGKEFLRARKGPRPKFCGHACQSRARYQRQTPGARRIKRKGLDS